MTAPKLCVFDLDGTLIDSLEDLAVSMNVALTRYGLPVHPVDDYRLFVGSGVKNLILRAAAPHPCPEELLAGLREAFDLHYNAHCFDHTRPYPGCMELLGALKEQGVQAAILSNKPDRFVGEIARRLFPEIPFSVVWGNRPEYPIKPDPASLLETIRLSGARPEDCLYIGDSDVDVFTAKNAGVKSCGACWGFRGEEELRSAGVDVLLTHPLDLIRQL